MFFVHLILIIIISSAALYPQNTEDLELPPEIRFIRVFGGNDESEPPILLLNENANSLSTPLGSKFITIEFDIQADVPPSLYAKFVHCSADWKEEENVFLNDIINNRTSNIQWEPAPITDGFYSYRGIIKVPNIQVKFKYAGNWKVKLFDYDNEEVPIATARFFVVKSKVKSEMRLYSDFYDPKYNFISPTSITVESIIYGNSNLFENQLNTVVLYRNHRWYEPYYISSNKDLTEQNDIYRYHFPTMVSGFITAGKIFRIQGLPAENEYRILNLSDLAAYPNINGIVRSPLPDYRRRGEFMERDDDGAMLTSFIADYNDNYVNMEFLLRPDNWYTENEVYVVGSFNNWKASPEWQMSYDKELGYYRLRQLIRRARHNYMYATGNLNITTNIVKNFSYDEYEGNNSNNSHTYILFIYYREFDYGGYDSIIGVSASTINGQLRRY